MAAAARVSGGTQAEGAGGALSDAALARRSGPPESLGLGKGLCPFLRLQVIVRGPG